MPPPRQLQTILTSASFLVTCATALSLAAVAAVALALAILVSLLFSAKAVPLAVVAGLAAAAAYAVLDKRRVAATALDDVGRLLSGDLHEHPPARAAAKPGAEPARATEPTGDPERARSKRDMIRSLLDKVVDTAFESVAVYVFGLPALAAFLASIAHRAQHDGIAWLFGVVAVLAALCGVVPYAALRYIVTKQLDSIMDAIPHAGSSAEVSALPASETSPLVK